MKKIIVLFMMLILSIAIVGCNNKEKVNVNFIIDGNTALVQIDKGSVITKDVVPLTKENKQTEIKLYYDEKYEKEYNNEKIESDITIYVKEEVVLDEETEKYIKQCYVNYHMAKDPVYFVTIDNVTIKYYYGDFDGIQIAVIKGDVGGNLIERPPFYVCLIEGKIYSIKYLPEIISVYYENNYYTLPDACEKGLITKAILDQLDCYDTADTIK